MIRPAGFVGAAFGTAASGDLRRDESKRARVARDLGVSDQWAYLDQVHSADVIHAEEPGNRGQADALLVTQPGLPVMVATADCVPVVVESDGAAAVVHAGWRGAAAGVLPAALDAMRTAGHEPNRAAIGPAIGPCCYEVGEEVASEFPNHRSTTRWGTTSIDIPGYLATQLAGIDVWRSEQCTFESDDLFSWRRDHDERRQVTVAWLPSL